jgi:hypothetical protein
LKVGILRDLSFDDKAFYVEIIDGKEGPVRIVPKEQIPTSGVRLLTYGQASALMYAQEAKQKAQRLQEQAQQQKPLNSVNKTIDNPSTIKPDLSFNSKD